MKPPVPITIRRRKTKVPTVTFLGSEGLEAVGMMLRVRQRGSPELKIRRYGKHEVKGGIPPESLTLEAPLFRSYRKFLKTLKDGTPEIKHLTPHAISVIIRKCAIRAGVYRKEYSAHALRRFFQTNLESSGMNPNWIKIMMGHKLSGTERADSKPQRAMLRNAYKEAYSYLAVSEAVEQRSIVKALKQQVEKLVLDGKRKDRETQQLEHARIRKITSLEKALEIRQRATEHVLKKNRDKIAELERKLADLVDAEMQEQTRKEQEEYARDPQAFLEKRKLSEEEWRRMKKSQSEFWQRQTKACLKKPRASLKEELRTAGA